MMDYLDVERILSSKAEYWKERRAMVFGLRCQVVNDDILSKYYYAIALTKATT